MKGFGIDQTTREIYELASQETMSSWIRTLHQIRTAPQCQKASA